jgi:Glyoxalase-like domain
VPGQAAHVPLPPAPPGDPESLIPPGLAPRRPPGRVARVEERRQYHGAFLRGNDLMLLMQRLDSGAPRVHLDIHTDDLDAEVARLERLGAERVQKVQTWWVMRDPAGLLFCVLLMSPGSLNDENAGQRVRHQLTVAGQARPSRGPNTISVPGALGGEQSRFPGHS